MIEGLLHPGSDGVSVVFGFDYGEWKVLFIIEQIIGFFGFTPFDGFAPNNDTSFGEINFLTDLVHHVPFFAILSNERGSDKLGADIRLGERFFIHASRAFSIA